MLYGNLPFWNCILASFKQKEAGVWIVRDLMPYHARNCFPTVCGHLSFVGKVFTCVCCSLMGFMPPHYPGSVSLEKAQLLPTPIKVQGPERDSIFLPLFQTTGLLSSASDCLRFPAAASHR